MSRTAVRIWAPLFAVLLIGVGDLAAQACEGALGGRQGIWLGYGSQVGAFSPSHSVYGSVAPGRTAFGALEVGKGGYDTGLDESASNLEARGGLVVYRGLLSVCLHAAYRLAEFDFHRRYGFDNGLVRDNVTRFGVAFGRSVWSSGQRSLHVWVSPEFAHRSFRLEGRTVIIGSNAIEVERTLRIDYRVNLAGSVGAALDMGALSLHGGVMRRPGSGVDALAFFGAAVRLRRD